MSSLTNGKCDEIKFLKDVSGIESWIVRDPAYLAGFEAGYEAAVETMERLLIERKPRAERSYVVEDKEEPEINPCRGCDDYDGRGGCKSYGGCGAERSEE